MTPSNTNDNAQIDRFKEEREFWDLYRELMKEKGVDISRFYAVAAEHVKQEFSTSGAKNVENVIQTVDAEIKKIEGELAGLAEKKEKEQ